MIWHRLNRIIILLHAVVDFGPAHALVSKFNECLNQCHYDVHVELAWLTMYACSIQRSPLNSNPLKTNFRLIQIFSDSLHRANT